jgi:DNA-directed RNA polymerase subunit RPC12/RpoP
MKTSTRNEPNDPQATQQVSPPGAVEGKATATIRCRLCRETILLESNFRPTAATCPHCGLKFVFDPQQEPLPVRGLRLRYSDVLEAQRRPGAVQHKRHEAHVQPVIQVPQPKPRTNYLAWAGGLALTLATAMVFFGGWFHRLLVR